MFADDVAAALDGCAAAVMIPKFVPGPHADLAMRALAEIESAWDLGAPTPVIGLIESAAGVLALAQPFTLPDGVVRLAFGAADYYADLGLPYQSSGTHTELAMATLVLACAAAGLPSPVASPHFSPGDHTGLVSVSKHARGLGFGGGLCIHPDQIGAVNALFRISNDERSWAHRVIDAWEDPASRTKGAITVDGALVDEAMVRHARSIL